MYLNVFLLGGALLNMMRISEGETDTGIPLEVSVEHLDIITGNYTGEVSVVL